MSAPGPGTASGSSSRATSGRGDARPDTGRPDHYALVLNGDAMAGPWLAGAALETLETLGRCVGTPRAGRVDVLVGARAGALAAAIAARSLTVNPTLLPFLEKLWVEAMDAGLWFGSPSGSGERRRSDLEEVTRALITADRAIDDGASPLAAGGLRLGLLTGEAPETFDLACPSTADDPVWERIRRTALGPAPSPLAWGLLPGGLPVGGLPAGGSAGLPAGGSAGRGPAGTDASEALRLARRLAGGGSAAGSRLYVEIDPERGDPGERPSDAARGVWFDALVERLPEIADGLRDPDALGLGHVVSRLAEDIAQEIAGDEDGDGLDALDATLARIRTDPRYADTLGAVESRAGRTRLAKLIYVLDAIAELDRADGARIRIAHRDGGRRDTVLFDPAARAREFAAGRRDAARGLRRALEGIETPTDPAVERSVARRPADAGVTRRTLEAFVDRETRSLLRAAPAGGIWGALGWLWKPATRKWVCELARRHMDGAG